MKNNKKPIFIVGSSRSGTTMMNRILGKNSKVVALNELHYLGAIWDINEPMKMLSKSDAIIAASKLIMHIDRDIWGGEVNQHELEKSKILLSAQDAWCHKDIYVEVLRSYILEDEQIFFTDQTPRNVFFVDKILELFPDAKILHMVRDPRAVLYSQKNRWKKRWRGASNMPLKNVFRVFFNYHPYTITKLWLKSARVALKHSNTANYKTLVFEELVKNPEKELNQVCDFLGVDFQPKMLEVPQVGSSNKIHDRASEGISSDVVEAWKGKLSKGDVYICERLSKKLLQKFSYQSNSNKSWFFYTLPALIRFPIHIIGSLLLNPKIIYIQIKALINLK